MEALKPCPFCGGDAEIWRAHPENPRRRAWIACVSGCAVLTKEHPTDAEAIAAWNRRAPDPRLEEAEKALEPFMALAKAVTDEGSPDYGEWLREANDWMVAFSFAGQSINLGQLRALAVLRGGTDAD